MFSMLKFFSDHSKQNNYIRDKSLWYLLYAFLFFSIVFIIPYGMTLKIIEIFSSNSIWGFLILLKDFVGQIFCFCLTSYLFLSCIGFELLHDTSFHPYMTFLAKFKLTEPIVNIIEYFREEIEEGKPIPRTIFKFWRVILTDEKVEFSFINFLDFFQKIPTEIKQYLKNLPNNENLVQSKYVFLFISLLLWILWPHIDSEGGTVLFLYLSFLKFYLYNDIWKLIPYYFFPSVLTFVVLCILTVASSLTFLHHRKFLYVK